MLLVPVVHSENIDRFVKRRRTYVSDREDCCEGESDCESEASEEFEQYSLPPSVINYDSESGSIRCERESDCDEASEEFEQCSVSSAHMDYHYDSGSIASAHSSTFEDYYISCSDNAAGEFDDYAVSPTFPSMGSPLSDCNSLSKSDCCPSEVEAYSLPPPSGSLSPPPFLPTSDSEGAASDFSGISNYSDCPIEPFCSYIWACLRTVVW